MKIKNSKQQIHSFGGTYFADKIIDNASIYEVIDDHIGKRGAKATYSYSDLTRSYLLMTLYGGECADDTTEHLGDELNQVENVKACSADTLLRMQKELATEKETFLSKNNIEHDFNINQKMNQFMVRLLASGKQHSSGALDYIFDYDNQFTPTYHYYKPFVFTNGDTLKQACDLSYQLYLIYNRDIIKPIAMPHLAQGFNVIELANMSSFQVLKRTFKSHYGNIINFFF